jgi:hypothetical protein
MAKPITATYLYSLRVLNQRCQGLDGSALQLDTKGGVAVDTRDGVPVVFAGVCNRHATIERDLQQHLQRIQQLIGYGHTALRFMLDRLQEGHIDLFNLDIYSSTCD